MFSQVTRKTRKGGTADRSRACAFLLFRSQIIYGDLVETLKPILEIIRKYMLLLFSVFNSK